MARGGRADQQGVAGRAAMCSDMHAENSEEQKDAARGISRYRWNIRDARARGKKSPDTDLKS